MSGLRGAVVAAVWLGIAGCGGGAKPGAKGPTPPGGAGGPTLIVAGEAGVQEIDLSGHVLRTITATPAEHARFIPGSTDLLFMTREPTQIKRIARDGSGERVVAALPATFTICDTIMDDKAGQSYQQDALDVQSEDEFFVDASGGRVCMFLMDRNLNMVDVRIELRVELASGKIAQSMEYPEGCPDQDPGVPACEAIAPAAAAAPAADPARVYTVEEGHVVEVEGGKRSLTAIIDEDGEFSDEDRRSPSGRWTIISGNPQQGDYIYRDLYLFDRHEGTIFPIVSGAWPAVVVPAAITLGEERQGPPTVTVVGESTIRWLPGLDRDVLQIDRLLITPGQGGVELAGALAY